MKIIQRVLAAVATLFGLVTVFAGTRAILGSDPGYVVYQPLLIFNSTMGFVYIAAGITIWRNYKQGLNMAAVIFFLNLIALISIYFLYTDGGAIAIDSLRAMLFRTGIWLGLLLTLWWLNRNYK